MLKAINDYQFTITMPCFIVIMTDHGAELSETADEDSLTNSYIKVLSDFYVVDSIDKVNKLINEEDIDEDDDGILYPTTLFNCSILIPKLYKIYKFNAMGDVVIHLQYTEDYIDEPIIQIEPLILTADKSMSIIQSFVKYVSGLTEPNAIFNKWLDITSMIGIDVDYIHLETYLAQTLACTDNDTQLFRTSDCKKALPLNLKQAIKKLYPIRSLFFENLGEQLTVLPFIEESELSTLDKLLLGKL